MSAIAKPLLKWYHSQGKRDLPWPSRSAAHFVIAQLAALAENIKPSGARWHTDIDPLEAP